METRIIEASSPQGNWGKFLVGRFDQQEWGRRSSTPGVMTQRPLMTQVPLLAKLGWGPEHIFVMDLQTGEGATFRHGGFAPADLNKHRIWVCPLFEPFLVWLYRQDVATLANLPAWVSLDAPLAMAGYRRPGPATGEKTN